MTLCMRILMACVVLLGQGLGAALLHAPVAGRGEQELPQAGSRPPRAAGEPTHTLEGDEVRVPGVEATPDHRHGLLGR